VRVYPVQSVVVCELAVSDRHDSNASAGQGAKACKGTHRARQTMQAGASRPSYPEHALCPASE